MSYFLEIRMILIYIYINKSSRVIPISLTQFLCFSSSSSVDRVRESTKLHKYPQSGVKRVNPTFHDSIRSK